MKNNNVVIDIEAIDECRCAAHQGFDSAQYALGRAYKEGLVGPEDIRLRKMIGDGWINESFSQGADGRTFDRQYRKFYRPAFVGRGNANVSTPDCA